MAAVTIQAGPGAASDPDRLRLFSQINLVCAGNPAGSVLCALIDALAATVVIVADDPRHAGEIIATIQRDLTKAAERNWHEVKAQIATAISEPGRG